MIRNTRYFPGESEKGASPAGYYDLAAAVVHRAVKDMRGIDDPSLHARFSITATVFLGSKNAARWMDAVGIDQADALVALKWEGYARTLLAVRPQPGKVSQRERANGPQRRVLERGIEALIESRKSGGQP
tara:strand:- start:496 stop:885 length:390 start_codon:yes stop_codon:yes gene_type:complete